MVPLLTGKSTSKSIDEFSLMLLMHPGKGIVKSMKTSNKPPTFPMVVAKFGPLKVLMFPPKSLKDPIPVVLVLEPPRD
jgi:hypothetical protein